MKPEGAFVAARPVAQHCPELLRTTGRPVDDKLALARLGSRLARILGVLLAPLLGGTGASVSPAQIRQVDAAALTLETPLLAGNSLLAVGADGGPMLATLDAGAILRIVDRAYGGKGTAPNPLPDTFPLSAELMTARLEAIVIRAIAEAAGLAPGYVQPVRRDSSLGQLAPFADDLTLTILPIRVSEDGQDPWDIVLAFPAPVAATLTGTAQPQRPRKSDGPATPHDAPFADLPLTLRAVLVDMTMGFSALARLEVGQVLPVAVARSVPLVVGDRTIAHGTVGALDDRVAIQITKSFS